MRLNSRMTLEDIRTALSQSALRAWGPERIDALQGEIDQTARALWRVLQVPLDPWSEEPDWQGPVRRPAGEV